MLPIRGSDLPLYVQVKNHIRTRIAAGEFKEGEALPGERELVVQLGLSRTTIRQAISDLVTEGVLVRHHGKGTFVAPHTMKQNLSSLIDLPEELRAMGHTPHVELLSHDRTQAPPGVAITLGIDAGDPVTFILRRVLSDEEPIVVVRTYLIESVGRLVLEGLSDSEPIYTRLERLGYPVHEGLQTISATRVHPRDADLLHVEAGTPALLLQRVTFIDPDVPVEYSEAVYRADRFQYQTKLKRTASGW